MQSHRTTETFTGIAMFVSGIAMFVNYTAAQVNIQFQDLDDKVTIDGKVTKTIFYNRTHLAL